MDTAGTILLVLGILSVLPIGFSMGQSHWRLGAHGQLEGPIIKNIERKKWHIRFFLLGAALCAAGIVLKLLAPA